MASFNKESKRLQDKFLMQEGIRRNCVRYKNNYYDLIEYGLLRSEFEERFSKYRKDFKII